MGYRIERDSLGEIRVPEDVYWGAQTQRAIENFPVSGLRFQPVFISSLGYIKLAAAEANMSFGLLKEDLAGAIIKASEEVIRGDHNEQFPLDIFQTGSGTSTNMNANEVIATRANEILKGKKDSKSPVHPNDHVNMGQSSNDVIPSAIHLSTSIHIKRLLLPSLRKLHSTIEEKSRLYDSVVKTGRTHLMDAMPLTLRQEMSGWAAQVLSSIERIDGVLPRLSALAIGGTAVGTGINTHPDFAKRVTKIISEKVGMDFHEATNHFEAQSSLDTILELSGQLKTLASAMMKIANDLRWMNSGPVSGLSEIMLPALQPGSSIMPGKVNPVIPEAVRMVSAQVMGNDLVIAIANSSGDFQLNVMLPVIAYNILQSITILGNVSILLADKAIAGMEVNIDRLRELVDKNSIIATVLNPLIGYDRAAEVVKRSLREQKSIRDVVVDMGLFKEDEAKKLLDPMKMTGHSND